MIATTGTDTLYYQYNNHGDVVRVLDQSGTLKNEYDYDAFGNAITEKETVKNPYRYAGYYQDTESGLYYLRSRYYNPKTARFLTEDTASGKYTDPLSLNKYTYCHNQPVTGYDPDGYALNLVAGAIGAGVGALIGGAFSYASQAWQNKSFTKGIDWKQVAGGAAEGAITGGIGGLTMGASLAATAGGTAVKSVAKVGIKAAAKTTIKTVAKSSAIDAVSGFAGNTASQLITGGAGNYSVTQAVTSGVVEALNIPGGEAGEKTAKKVGNELMETLSEKLGKAAGSEVAEEAGSKAITKTLTNSSDAGLGAMPNEQITPDSISMPKTDFFAGPEGIAKSLDEYDALAKTSTSSIGNGKQYSVMYQANTGSGKSRSAHRNAANRQFYNQMKNNPEFKQSVDDYFGYDVMKHMKSGKGSLKNPSSDWVWHHSAESPDIIQLIPKKQHQASELQSILHPGPNGEGGFGLYY